MTPLAKRKIGDTGLALPVLGFGCAPLGGLFEAVDDAEAATTLNEALAHDMRYVDTAPFYGFGLSERRVGDVLRAYPHPYVLSTKVGRLLMPKSAVEGAVDAAALGWPGALPFRPVHDYSYDGIMRSFEASLHRLGLERVDMLYVHDIGEMTLGADNNAHFKTLTESGYKAMHELRHDGRVKAIGIGVNEIQVCLDALNIGAWDMFLLAGRYTFLEQEAVVELFPKCQANGVSIVVGGAFNSGILVGGNTWNYAAAPDHVVAKVRQLTEVCESYKVPLAAAALQFPLGHDIVKSILPGLRNRKELADTLSWITHAIPAEFWDALKNKNLLHPDAPTPSGNPFYAG